mmetsp:Transcript_44116/g.109608  ORF Transcript_44116/g.109608 Transcript_44116/m.109608 type:complete len:110 (+) Transcript_44116:215-544(+)
MRRQKAIVRRPKCREDRRLMAMAFYQQRALGKRASGAARDATRTAGMDFEYGLQPGSAPRRKFLVSRTFELMRSMCFKSVLSRNPVFMLALEQSQSTSLRWRGLMPLVW